METLVIKEVKSDYCSPFVQLDPTSKIFEISGESYLEDTDSFYQPIYQWLEEYSEKYTEPFTFNFKFTYFNSSSSKALLKLLKILKNYAEKNTSVKINWYYPEDNQDLLLEGEDFMNILDLPIQFVPIQVDY